MRKVIIPLAVLFLASCYTDKEDQLYPKPITGGGCDTSNISFATHVQPIMNQYCVTSGCHDAATKSYGYDLSNYEGAKATALNGRLTGSIKWETGYLQMPKALPQLSACEISKITAWVNAGMPK